MPRQGVLCLPACLQTGPELGRSRKCLPRPVPVREGAATGRWPRRRVMCKARAGMVPDGPDARPSI